jgi:hypothetical protein
MTKQELLAVLNEDAPAFGIDPITIRQLSDWVDDKLIDGAKAKGVRRGINPDWRFSEEAIVRARLIVKSISCGSSRKAQHRIFVWVHGHEYSFDRIRSAIISEFGRFLKRQRRQLEWQYDHRNRVDPKKKERFLNQIPELDEELKKVGLEQPPEARLLMMSEVYWGAGGNETALEMLSAHIAEQFGIPVERIAEVSSKINHVGLLGNSDEIRGSSLRILKNANECDLLEGRSNLQSFLTQITQLNSKQGFSDNEILDRIRGVIGKASNSVLRPDWLISTLASSVVAAHKLRKGSS